MVDDRIIADDSQIIIKADNDQVMIMKHQLLTIS
jgi:hypothetical protein